MKKKGFTISKFDTKEPICVVIPCHKARVVLVVSLMLSLEPSCANVYQSCYLITAML